jgi:hypothetical protein
VVVEAAVSIGIGPGPVPPDLDAPELPCRLEVEVPGGGRVDVEVSFQPEGDLPAQGLSPEPRVSSTSTRRWPR